MPPPPSPGNGLKALAILLVIAAGLMVWADRNTSTTFDEIVLVSMGARGWHTGDWGMVVDQPPLMPRLYGAAAAVAARAYPPENRVWDYNARWSYARDFYFTSGNDPRVLATATRALSMLCALALLGLTARAAGPSGPGSGSGGAGAGFRGTLAALLLLSMPDFLAHGAVAYNDMPLALAYLGAILALDRWAREPGPVAALLAGVLVALALGVKFSAVALGPVALGLVALEGLSRGWDETWGRTLFRSLLPAGLGFWGASVLVYGGDLLLLDLWAGLEHMVRHATQGHPAPAYFFGATSPAGWWWFFPAALFFKLPVTAPLIVILAMVGLWLAHRTGEGALLASPLRGPLLGLLVFLAFLLRSNLNVGTRYALPLLPLLAILGAAGLHGLWTLRSRSIRRTAAAAAGILMALFAAETLSRGPHFLAFENLWVRGRPSGSPALADSSVDWGQGALALARWMEAEDVGMVRLSYFGSAVPEAYGVEYVPLPSFLELRPVPTEGAAALLARGERPPFTVISRTNLLGLYFPGADPYAAYRDRVPEVILAGSIHVYRD